MSLSTEQLTLVIAIVFGIIVLGLTRIALDARVRREESEKENAPDQASAVEGVPASDGDASMPRIAKVSTGGAPGTKGPMEFTPSPLLGIPVRFDPGFDDRFQNWRCPDGHRALALVEGETWKPSWSLIEMLDLKIMCTTGTLWGWSDESFGSRQKPEDTPPPSVGSELGAQRGNPTPAISESEAPDAEGEGQRHQTLPPVAGGETALGTSGSGLGMQPRLNPSGFTLDDLHERLSEDDVFKTCLPLWLRGEPCEHGPVTPYRWPTIRFGAFR